MAEDTPSYWTTAVSDVDETDVHLRGYALRDIIGRLSFPAVTYLLIRGGLPTPGEARTMDALLCSVLDYSLQKPGTVAARYCVSANPSMVAGVATAMLAVGEYTLAPDDAGRFIAETYAAFTASGEPAEVHAAKLVAELRQAKRRIPGFGHPNFRHVDPRAERLKEIAREGGVWGPACDWYETVHAAFRQATARPEIVINEVGMMAAILVEMGFTPQEMTGIALISSMPGVVAHISEELQSNIRIRTVPEGTASYRRDRRSLDDDLATAGWPRDGARR